MTKEQYLNQARVLYKKIDIKLEHYLRLKALAEKSTTTLTGMPRGGGNKADDNIAKLVDMSNEINCEISELINLQQEIYSVIKNVKGIQGVVLESYYLCFMTWQAVADRLGYEKRTIYRIHNEAIKKVVIPQEKRNEN